MLHAMFLEWLCSKNYYNCFTVPSTVSGTTWVSRYQKGKIRRVESIWIYWSKR